MPKRFKNYSTFESDGIHVQIDRTTSLHNTHIRIWKSYSASEAYVLTPEGRWELVAEGAALPASITVPADVLQVLKAALNEEETPTIAANAVIHDALKIEQSRVDKLLDHLLKP